MRSQLQNVLTPHEQMHTQIFEGLSPWLEVYNGVELRVKLSLKDKGLPLIVKFVYEDSEVPV